MNDPHGDTGAATFTAGHDGACDDAALLGKIGQGDEDAMAAFYREHGRVVLAQVLLVTGERVLAEEIVQDTMLAVWRGRGLLPGRVVGAVLGDRHRPAADPGPAARPSAAGGG